MNYKKEKNGEALEKHLKSFVDTANSQVSLVEIASQMFGILLEKERAMFLEKQENEGLSNKGNGHYNRSLATTLGSLDIAVPRDRNGTLHSLFLPERWKRSDREYDQFVLQLILDSYHPNKISALLKSMGLPYSPDQIASIVKDLHQEAQHYFSRDLPAHMLALFIDGFHTSMKHPETHRVQKCVIYVALGLDMDGFSHILGFWVSFGSENKQTWMKHLAKLIERGLTHPMIVISDDLPGITDAIATMYAQSAHQLCLVHLQRNFRKHLDKEKCAEVKDCLSRCKLDSYENAVASFSALLKTFNDEHPSLVNYHSPRVPLYFQFLRFPPSIQSLVYTTNKVESFNSMLRNLTRGTGYYFQSQRTLDVTVFVALKRLLANKWRMANKNIVGQSYRIHQLFRTMFPDSDTLF